LELASVFVIGTVGVVAFIAMATAWRNRKQQALSRDMKRHLQGITVGPYDPMSS